MVVVPGVSDSNPTSTPNPALIQVLATATEAETKSSPGAVVAYEVDALPGLALILLSHEVALDPPVVGTDSALKLMDRSGAVLDLSGDYLDHRKGNFVNYSAGTSVLAFEVPQGSYQVSPEALWLADGARFIGPSEVSVVSLSLAHLPAFAVIQNPDETGVDVAPTEGLETSSDYLSSGLEWLGKDIARAKADLTESLRRDPSNVDALVARAAANAQLGLREEAKEDLKQAIEIGIVGEEDRAYALLRLSGLYEIEEDETQQMDTLTRAVEIGVVSAPLQQRALAWLQRAAREKLGNERSQLLENALADLDAAIQMEAPDADATAGSYLSGSLYQMATQIISSTAPPASNGEAVLQKRGMLLAQRGAVLSLLGRDNESVESLAEAALFAMDPSRLDAETEAIYESFAHHGAAFAEVSSLNDVYSKIGLYPNALRLRLFWAGYWMQQSAAAAAASTGSGDGVRMRELTVAEFSAAIELLAGTADAPAHTLPLAYLGRADAYMGLGRMDDTNADVRRAEELGLVIDRDRREIVGFSPQ